VPGLHEPGFLPRAKPGLSALLEAASGAALGWLAIVAIRWVATKALRKEAMGLGDAKLLALVGAFTSPIGVLYTLLLGSLVGALMGSVWLAARLRALAPVAGTIAVEGAEPVSFSRARLSEERAVVAAERAPEEGARVRLRLLLRADDLFEEADVPLALRGTVEPGSTPSRVSVRLEETSPADAERLARFALVRRYIPFGPFLALGGAAMLLYGEEVRRFVTETWPSWIRGG
jgi:hypothetical protein